LDNQNEDVIKLEDVAKGLNSISWDVLKMLTKNESLTYSQIKTKLGVGQNKATNELNRLRGAILIQDKRDEMDARILHFSITDYGMKILKYKDS
jgi:DNA-binding MarR family transcriptional regulator